MQRMKFSGVRHSQATTFFHLFHLFELTDSTFYFSLEDGRHLLVRLYSAHFSLFYNQLSFS